MEKVKVEVQTTYELLVTPSMVADNKIGIVRHFGDGTTQTAYINFDHEQFKVLDAPKVIRRRKTLDDLLHMSI